MGWGKPGCPDTGGDSIGLNGFNSQKDQLPFPFHLGIAGERAFVGYLPLGLIYIEIVNHFLVFCRSHDVKWEK